MTRVLLMLGLLLIASAALAHAPPPPANLDQRAGFDQRLGLQLPMDRTFHDADGRAVTLRQLAGGKPLLLALGYFQCPNLCDVVLNGMAHSIAQLPLQPGRDFQVVFVSIDPRETPAIARHSQQMLASMQPRANVPRWHLLTGDEGSVHALAQAVGFRYFYDPRNRQYAHAAGLVAVTPQGKIAQYFFGVSYPPDSVRLALVGASAGKLGNLIDQLVLLCCGYDPSTGRYSVLIGRVMQVVGVGFVLLLAGGLLWMRRRTTA